MEIRDDNFNNAVEIITGSHLTVKLSFCVPVHDSYSNVYPILIHECPSAITKLLVNAGYMCTMTAKGLSVDKI